MRLFLTILEGRTPHEAKPIVATEDPAVIAAAARELMNRLAPGRPVARILDLAAKAKPADPEAGR